MRELWYILAGLVSGLLAGMGMGGGTLLIPILTLLLGMEQRRAQGVNMLAFLPAALAAMFIHRKEGRMATQTARPMLPAGIAGAVLGAWAAVSLEGAWLQKLFGLFLFCAGILQWRET